MPVKANEPAFSLAQIAAGRYDLYIRQWAVHAAAWGHPFFLRFDWEMNASWYPWGADANDNTAADYVSAWRHVHDIFTSVGATDATWVWCPNVDPNHSLAPLGALYPGDAYVDWTCVDVYNGGSPWRSFSSLLEPTYKEITDVIAPNKPFLVGEAGSTETGGSKAEWIKDMFTSLPTEFPKVRALLWFDQYKPGPGGHVDWPIEASASAASAFAAGISNAAFLSSARSQLAETGDSVQPAVKGRY